MLWTKHQKMHKFVSTNKKKLKMVKTITYIIKFIETGDIFGKFTLRY